MGKRLVLAFRDNFIVGDGPFYSPGAVAASASASVQGARGQQQQQAAVEVEVLFTNLPPGEQPLPPPTSSLGVEWSASPAVWPSACPPARTPYPCPDPVSPQIPQALAPMHN